jgi:HAD superfamily hydrolase (TIGR01509 family)
MPDLIIFDMDGVLLDSEPMHRELNQGLFRELGANVSDAAYNAYIGMATPLMWQMVIDTWSLPYMVEELVQQEQERKYQEFSTRPLEPSAGLVTLLQELKAAGRKLAVASGSPGRNIALVLERLGIAGYFDAVVSSEEVAQGKPAPDVFLEAARRVGVAPARCAVIEDAANGIRAARAAEMPCVGYQNPTSGHQDLSAAHLIVDSLHSPLLRKFLGL